MNAINNGPKTKKNSKNQKKKANNFFKNSMFFKVKFNDLEAISR